MALPPKGDPRRPLHLAVSSMRVLAVLFFLPALCMIPFSFRATPGGPGRFLALGVFGVVFLFPAVANVVLSIYIKKYHFWAVVSALVLASLETVFTLVMAISASVQIVTTHTGTIIMIVMWLVVIALAQLILHLAMSLSSLKRIELEAQRGFEVLGVHPVQPQPLPLPQNPTTPPDAPV